MRSTSSVRKSRTVRSMRSGSAKEQLGRAGRLHVARDALPLLEQDVQIAHEEARLLAFAHGADDHAHAFGQGRARVRMRRSRWRSLGSSILREMPHWSRVGHEDEVAARRG